MTDCYAPLTMPRTATRRPTEVRVEARRHLVLSLWLAAMMAVATVTVLMARPAEALTLDPAAPIVAPR
ncbi:hypothetical protein [Alsobacter sp. R-9]